MLYKEDRKYDSILLLAVMLLVMIGLLMIYSSSEFRAEQNYSDSTLFLKNHLVRVIFGIILMLIASKIDYRRYKVAAPFIFLSIVILLIFVFFGHKVNGSRRALVLFGKDFQPSELMKLGVIFYLAALFGKKWKGSEIPDNRILVHYGIILAVIGLIFLEPDLGTSLVIFLITIIMFFLGGVKLQLITRMMLGLLPIVISGLLIFSYQMKRLSDYVSSVFGNGDMSYQIEQSIMGLANGGLIGTGYGSGTQKLLFLPEPFSDFILASLGEELGFIGILIVFLLLAVILWRGMKIARQASDKYGMLLAAGITFLIVITALLNAGVVVNLIPTTGLPFPFLSYGGSSLLVLMTGIGIMLNISKDSPLTMKRFTRQRARTLNRNSRRN